MFTGSPMFQLHSKLAFLQKQEQWWNWNVFGDLRLQIAKAETDLMATECNMQNQWSQQLQDTWCSIKARSGKFDTKENLLQEKSRETWLTEGDRKSAYFHTAIKVRAQCSKAQIKLADGSFSSDPNVVGQAAVEFFQNLFTRGPCTYQSSLLDKVPTMVNDEDNVRLCGIPLEQEIWQAVKGLNPTSAPGLDGFTGLFYTHCWDIIKKEAAVQDFFYGGEIDKGIATTKLVLIPKVPKPESMADMR